MNEFSISVGSLYPTDHVLSSNAFDCIEQISSSLGSKAEISDVSQLQSKLNDLCGTVNVISDEIISISGKIPDYASYDNKLVAKNELCIYALSNDVPTCVSQLSNDTGFVTVSSISSKVDVSSFNQAIDSIEQSLSDKADASALAQISDEVSYKFDKRYGGEVSGDLELVSGNIVLGNGSTEFPISTYEAMLQAAIDDPTDSNSNAAKAMNAVSNDLSDIAYSQTAGKSSIAIGGYALGENSIAIGHLDRDEYFPDNAIALGKNSIALGNIATAAGLGAVALGSGVAKGKYSLALGGGVANGRCSIAMQNTKANAQYSIALGHGSIADEYVEEDGSVILSNNIAATSIGKNAYSSGRGAVAIGSEASAIGIGPVAIGYKAQAIGRFSIANGANVAANGSYSYVAGLNSESLSNNSYSFVWNGNYRDYTVDNKYKSHGSGSFNISPLNGLSGFYIGNKNLCAIIDEAMSSIQLDSYLNKQTGGEVSGDVAVVSNDLEILSGNYIQTTTLNGIQVYSASNSFIQANETFSSNGTSYGPASIGSKGFIILDVISAENKVKLSVDGTAISDIIPESCYTSTWSIALANQLNAQFSEISTVGYDYVVFKNIFDNIISVDGQPESYFIDLIAAGDDNALYCPTHPEIGNCIISKFTSNHAEGGSTHAIAQFAHAEGRYTFAEGRYSHAEGGNGTTAGGVAAHAEGFGTKALGNRSHSEGSLTYATKWSAHAEGSQTSALGNGSHSEGHFTLANGHYSHTEGVSCIANGLDGAHAEGFTVSAFGHGSHAEGYRTLANAEGSHTEGRQTYAGGKFAHAEGGGYEDTTSTYFSGGYATGIGSHAEGRQTSAVGDYSHAEGRRTLANAENAHAAGYRCEAYSINSTAIGRFAKVLSTDIDAFTWQGVHESTYYESKGPGTFCINPKNSLSGFYIGSSNFIDCVLNAVQQMNQIQKDALKSALGL